MLAIVEAYLKASIREEVARDPYTALRTLKDLTPEEREWGNSIIG